MLIAFLLLAQAPVPAPPSRFDKVMALEIGASDPVLAGHGRSKRVEYVSEFSGTLHVWTKIDPKRDAGTEKAGTGLDLFLRVEDAQGKLVLEDDNSGGGKTPYVSLALEPGRRLIVLAAAASADDLGQLELHLVAAPETESTRAASSVAKLALAEIKRLREAKDLEAARAQVVKTIDELLAAADASESELVCRRLWELAYEASRLALFQPTARARRLVHTHRSHTLPDEHPELQAARGNLAVTIKALGDLAGARTLEQKVLDVFARTLPDDHGDLQIARGNLAVTLKAQGDLAGAKILESKVLEVRTRTLPDEHRDLQVARLNLAKTIKALGDLAGARALEEKVLEVESRTLPDEHPDLQLARMNFAVTIQAQGDLAGARALEEKVLDIDTRTLPGEHPDLQAARLNFAATIKKLGNLTEARRLEAQVLEIFSRTLPDEHPNLQVARLSLAATLDGFGDLAGARALEEKVLEVRSRTLPDDHPDLQLARQDLAVTIYQLGDLDGARDLEQRVLEVRSRTLPDEHPDLQLARLNLAAMIYELGDLAGARELLAKVLEVDSRTLPGDHPDLQVARANLAVAIEALGDLAGARTLEEKVIDVLSRTLPDEHSELQRARANLAATIANQFALTGRAPGTKEALIRDQVQAETRCTDLIGALCRAQVRAAREAIVGSPGREAEERCSNLARRLDSALSFARGLGVFAPLHALEAESFVLAETTRGAAIVSAALVRKAASAPKYDELRLEQRLASDVLARLAQEGTTSEEFDRARTRRESAERELTLLARELSRHEPAAVEFDVASLATKLSDGEAAVGFRRFKKTRVEVVNAPSSTAPPAMLETSVDELCAFVLRNSKPDAAQAARPLLTLVDLGPIGPIEDAAHGWRKAIGVGLERGMAAGDSTLDLIRKRGDELRTLVFDPLLAALGDSDHLVIALDDVLHSVPLEALPLADAGQLVGDRWRIETRATLTELSADSPKPTGTALVALGGASFNLPPLTLSSQEVAGVEGTQPVQIASVLRGTAWERGFPPLTHTADEARGIGALYRELFESKRPALVLEQRKASRAALEELAPKARFLHIATHGWFAPESIKSWSDPEPLDKKSGLGMRMSGAEQVKGMSPMLLCGLALAGANLPENAAGRVPGLVTAEEISTLDLSNCELVVLSACDTNVGERRAGQGVASLQKALQMAGARSVITSLWKVPDEATKELMLDFYRRLWVEKKPKWQALWEAKKKLREAKDESGALKYTTRDWAAWILTGDPQ